MLAVVDICGIIAPRARGDFPTAVPSTGGIVLSNDNGNVDGFNQLIMGWEESPYREPSKQEERMLQTREAFNSEYFTILTPLPGKSETTTYQVAAEIIWQFGNLRPFGNKGRLDRAIHEALLKLGTRDEYADVRKGIDAARAALDEGFQKVKALKHEHRRVTHQIAQDAFAVLPSA